MQAIAREDKGILGKDYNRSDKTYFRTTSYNPTVAPVVNNNTDTGVETVYRPRVTEERGVRVFRLAGIIVGSLLGVLIIVGAVWNIVQRQVRHKSESEEESGGSDSDSMELDLSNTDLESRVGTSSRPPSRARSYRSAESLLSLSSSIMCFRSRRRSPMSVRTWSPSPSDSSPDAGSEE